jgi:hypothetical protein
MRKAMTNLAPRQDPQKYNKAVKDFFVNLSVLVA